MQNKRHTLVVALTGTSTTNIMNPGTTTGGVGPANQDLFVLIHKIRAVNKTASSGNFSLWRGATGANAAGTEVVSAKVVPANDAVEIPFWGGLRLDVADFLVGGANAVTTITLVIDYEIGVR